MSDQLKHLGLILDGNRRWAKKRDREPIEGHTEGLKNFKDRVIDVAGVGEIDYLTAYTLSTENFKNRSEYELKHLFSLIEDLINHKEDFLEHKIRLKVIGKPKELPKQAQETLTELVNETQQKNKLTLTLAINYGGKDEIVRAAERLCSQENTTTNITESKFSEYLDTSFLPPMDLLIRTGGHKRISNFLLWSLAYAEFYFTDTLWPSFDKEELEKAIDYFHKTKRKFGT